MFILLIKHEFSLSIDSFLFLRMPAAARRRPSTVVTVTVGRELPGVGPALRYRSTGRLRYGLEGENRIWLEKRILLRC